MNKEERERRERLDRTLAHWEAGKEVHDKFQLEHPPKPLTPQELKWLEDYQKLTHDPRWW